MPARLRSRAICWSGIKRASSRINEVPQIPASRLANETFILPEQISGTLEVAAQGGFVPRLGPQPGSLVAVKIIDMLGEELVVRLPT